MADPTYDKEKILANPEWHIAWILSEIRNDSAPIGWGRYLYEAQELLRHYDVTRKSAPDYAPYQEAEAGEHQEVLDAMEACNTGEEA